MGLVFTSVKAMAMPCPGAPMESISRRKSPAKESHQPRQVTSQGNSFVQATIQPKNKKARSLSGPGCLLALNGAKATYFCRS